MAEVVIHAPRQYVERGWPASSASIEVEGRNVEVFYRASQGPLADGAEPFVPAGLFAAMRLGVPLRIETPVSPLLLEQVQEFQAIVSSWFDGLQQIAIDAPQRHQVSLPPQRGAGCFFTGGIDSFYSALKHQSEITHLIFVHGFDIRLHETDSRASASRLLRHAASELGKPLIEVETNARDLLDTYADWMLHTHGAALGGVALLLTPLLQRAYIGATDPYGALSMLGSHPLLDHLWGTEDVQVVHDGLERDRWHKLEHIHSNPTVLRHLRVCWLHPDGAVNCCRCSKCLRTMSLLQALGVLDQCPTFPLALSLDDLRALRLPNASLVYATRILADMIEEIGTAPDVAQALRQAISQSPVPVAEAGAMLPPAPTPDVAHLEAQMRAERARSAQLEAQIQRLMSSRSWKLTEPLRRAARVTHRQNRGIS